MRVLVGLQQLHGIHDGFSQQVPTVVEHTKPGLPIVALVLMPTEKKICYKNMLGELQREHGGKSGG